MENDIQKEIIDEYCTFLKKVNEGERQQEKAPVDYLVELIDCIPPYGRNSSFMKGFYGKLAVIYGVSLPDDALKPPPDEGGFMCHIQYTYSGSYSGYRDAFCGLMKMEEAAEEMKKAIEAQCGEINSDFWSKYAVTLVTDGVVKNAKEVPVNRKLLDSDLSDNYNILCAGAAAGVSKFYEKGYGPAAAQIGCMRNDGVMPDCRALMENGLAKDETLTANINRLLSMGGPDGLTAEWILFHFFVILEVLGSSKISEVIDDCVKAGMMIPLTMRGDHWRNGTYRDWLQPVCGEDMLPYLRETKGNMPVAQWSRFGMKYMSYTLGYPLSLCKWGTLARYK